MFESMAKPSDSPGFDSLLTEWNRILKESGLKDIERSQGGELELKRPGTMRRYESMDLTTREAKEEYFRLVAMRVASTDFKNEREEKILNLYAQGMSQAEIQKRLKIRGHRCKVYYPLYRWLKEWHLK
jgi:ATP/maltotriose-dependent transcriptional regulator MalT